jgi:hypothetical protein
MPDIHQRAMTGKTFAKLPQASSVTDFEVF